MHLCGLKTAGGVDIDAQTVTLSQVREQCGDIIGDIGRGNVVGETGAGDVG